MKVGIIGAGAVGSACLTALVARGCAREIVVVNRDRKRAEGLVTDVQYGAVLCPYVELRAGEYTDLEGAALVMVTAGANEKTGGATDRSDPSGRLRLLDANAAVYQSIVPQLHAVAPQALILVVTDPPGSAGRCRSHARARAGSQYRDISRQLAFPVSPGAAARDKPGLCRCADCRRARHDRGVPLVFRSHRRDAGFRAAGAKLGARPRAVSPRYRAASVIRQHYHNRRYRSQSARHWDRVRAHCRDLVPERAGRHSNRLVQRGIRRHAIFAEHSRTPRRDPDPRAANVRRGA